LILAECAKLKARLALELQAAKDDRRAYHREFQEFMAELLQTLDQIRAAASIEAQLLNLLRDNHAGDKERKGQETQTQTGRNPSYQRRDVRTGL
jgi:argininosuccinate lyase